MRMGGLPRPILNPHRISATRAYMRHWGGGASRTSVRPEVSIQLTHSLGLISNIGRFVTNRWILCRVTNAWQRGVSFQDRRSPCEGNDEYPTDDEGGSDGFEVWHAGATIPPPSHLSAAPGLFCVRGPRRGARTAKTDDPEMRSGRRRGGHSGGGARGPPIVPMDWVQQRGGEPNTSAMPRGKGRCSKACSV